ncbi:hypothetical protein FHR22_001037 [Sphingopyxis panaciterrae]|uniref:hypothetical protein n=1 Tax=Sphingopyxis panaciterrae TaxID=363841 RepID=UPI001420CC28|nr:hypothetical protein [Sphingopyxis panaciterrae]NIJ36388.1 hypothetical protein [Sphingopyxis panaciterrae]
MIKSLSTRALPAAFAIGAGVILCGMAPGDMNIAAFLARAEPVMRLGPLAAATPEGHRLKDEVVAAGKRYKARIDAQRKAGLKTTSCPPESGSMSPEEWLAHLRSYPASQRRSVSVYSAFDALMKKRYPCRN